MYKKGDKYIVKNHGEENRTFVEKMGTVLYLAKEFGNPSSIGVAYTLEKALDGKADNFVDMRNLEKFIEPKFKKGYKIHHPCNWIMEVVGFHLNKKIGEYVYLLFDVNDGYSICTRESELSRWSEFKKTEPKKKVVELTVAEISKKLGVEVKVVK